MNKTSKIIKIIKRIVFVIIIIFAVLIVGLSIYSSTSYQALPEMDDAIETLDLGLVTYTEGKTSIKYEVDQPKSNIIFVPGGLVEPDSYKYLAVGLALDGYNVTIVKVLFNLAILTPNSASRFIDKNLDNVIIGHSLGGVVASMVASNHSEITKIVMMGSYPIKNIDDKASLFITAEHDDAMDQEKLKEQLDEIKMSEEEMGKELDKMLELFKKMEVEKKQ